MGITNIGADAAKESQQTQDQSDSTDENEFERFDLSGLGFGKQHPTTAVRGTAVALRDLYNEQDRDRPDVAVILDDPSIVTGEDALDGSVVVTSEEEGDQFKVVNLDDDDTKHLEDMGIDFAGNTYYGDVGTEFEDLDRIALKRGGGAGRRIARTLDAYGAPAAATEEDDGDVVLHEGGFPKHNKGLIEYDNSEDSELPRYARATQLRPDVDGHDVIVMVQRLAEIDADYEGPAYWATVFASLPEDRMQALAEDYAEQFNATKEDDVPEKSAEDYLTELDGDTFVRLQPTDEFGDEISTDLIQATGWIEWNRPSMSETNQVRIEEGLDVYVPDGMSVDEVLPDDVSADDVDLTGPGVSDE